MAMWQSDWAKIVWKLKTAPKIVPKMVNWWSFDDWSMNNDDEGDNMEYDDYVQPTRKPLIFKELLNTQPLANRNYESKR